MIGFYDYTVVVTYISLVSSILGMFCAIDGRLTSGGILSGFFRTV